MPPRVHCAEVETSTGYQRPCGFSQALSWSSTTPGWTVTSARFLSKPTTSRMYLRRRRPAPAHRLAALRGAGAARQDRGLGVARHVERQREVGLVARQHDADRLDLVDRGVGRIAAARGGVEKDVALDGAAQGLFERSSVEFHSGRGHDLLPFLDLGADALGELGRRSRRRPAPSGPSRSPAACRSFSALTTSAYMRSTIGCGVPLMAHRPYQVETIQFGTPISAAVGMSGNSAMRCGVATARPIRLAGRICVRRGAHAVEHHVGIAGQQVLHGRARAAIGHVR